MENTEALRSALDADPYEKNCPQPTVNGQPEKAARPPLFYLSAVCMVAGGFAAMIQIGEWTAPKQTRVILDNSVPETIRAPEPQGNLDTDFVSGVIIEGTTLIDLPDDRSQIISPSSRIPSSVSTVE